MVCDLSLKKQEVTVSPATEGDSSMGVHCSLSSKGAPVALSAFSQHQCAQFAQS